MEMMTRTSAPVVRGSRDLQVRGVVQGVGFRPFVWRLAARHAITGWVRNDGGLVTIHAEGGESALDAFTAALAEEAPPLARVDDVRWVETTSDHPDGFDVIASADEEAGERLVPSDAATCPACLAELFDPADRRYRYAFINCTDCGPRFTIIDALPYDRARTSMRGFTMCEDCRREYEDPADRRFHAEPVACPACGPQLVLTDPAGEPLEGDPIERTAELLKQGRIVAVKGLGGFHLACDATNQAAVAALRVRKRRPDKPLAVMVASNEDLDAWFDVTPQERETLCSWRAPIVLVQDRGLLASSVAPGHRRHGAMLPSTPLHHLLTRQAGLPLVMTSGNASDEPICIDERDAYERLGVIADAFLVHDRPIVSRYDDSVVLVRGDERAVLRRARSFAPHPISLPEPLIGGILGTGAELHGAFCLAKGSRAYLSQHLGDITDDAAMQAYVDALGRARTLFGIEPALVAHDLHPDLLTTRFAEETGLPREPVQHHHAHVAATMAEYGLDGEVLGVAFDGLGLGTDGTIWGGELLRCTSAEATRVGRLRPVRQPGGDAAARHPWRMAVAHLADAGLIADEPALAPSDAALHVVLGQLESGLASPWTSSAGRLFDAVASILGIGRDVTFDGQAAMLLEQATDTRALAQWPAFVRLTDTGDLLELDTRDLIRAVVEERTDGLPVGAIARRFHVSLAEAVADACERLARGLDRVVLGGGVFQNVVFTEELRARLALRGFSVYVPCDVPAGDGGIALGQVFVASARRGA
jgi:hydrogenase maturation protein HypF